MKLNFKRKAWKRETSEKDYPKIIDNIEHENMPSISVCDTCKISISNAVLHFNLCLKEYHPYCAHPMSNFPDKFPNQTYVCPSCIHNNNSSFHHFVSRAAYCMFDVSQNFIKKQYKKWSALSSYNKIDIIYLTFPCPSTYCISPTQEQMLVKSKNGIANYFNNCYMSVIVQSLLGAVVQRFIPSILEYPSEIVSVLDSCSKKLSGENKSNSVNLSREFSLLSEKSMSIDLQKKEDNDAFEFLERLIDFIISKNPLSDEYLTYPYFSFITCLSCKSTVGEVISHEKNIVLAIPEQDDSITLESLLYAKCFCSLKEEDERTLFSSGCPGKIHETSILGRTPKLFAVCTARNNSSTVYCETPVEVPYFMYLDSFIGDSCGSVTYALVVIIYRYGSRLSTGHFNYVLFNRDGTSILFDDTKKCIYETADVLRDVERQKHRHIAIYLYEKIVSTQFYPTDNTLPWSYDSSHLQAVENIYYGNAEIHRAITERDMF